MRFYCEMNELLAEKEYNPEVDALSKPLVIQNDASQSIRYEIMYSIFF